MDTKKCAGIVCCSNGQQYSKKSEIVRLEHELCRKGITSVYSDYIFVDSCVSSGTARERADALMKLYLDESIDVIYDISGGDIANEILSYIDYDIIGNSNKVFYGYSDLTTLINAIYTITGNLSVLYQVKNLVWDITGEQSNIFMTDEMYRFSYRFVQGSYMSGTMVGGNIRCLLKLAGTQYFPDMHGKILFLESLSGDEAQIRAYFTQLKQIGVFHKVNGVMLGTFSEMNNKNKLDDVISIALDNIGESVPVVITHDIGHGTLSRALIIGKEYTIS